LKLIVLSIKYLPILLSNLLLWSSYLKKPTFHFHFSHHFGSQQNILRCYLILSGNFYFTSFSLWHDYWLTRNFWWAWRIRLTLNDLKQKHQIFRIFFFFKKRMFKVCYSLHSHIWIFKKFWGKVAQAQNFYIIINIFESITSE